MQETQAWSLIWEDPLEKEMETYASMLAWRIPWTEEPGGLHSMRLQRVRDDLVTDQPTNKRSEMLIFKKDDTSILL